MKIGVILDKEYATDVRVLHQTECLLKLGYEVHILSFGQTHSPKSNIVQHSPSFSIGLNKKLRALQNLLDVYTYIWSKAINNFIKQYSIDVIHVHDLYLSKAGYKAIQSTNAKMVLDLHENYKDAINQYRWAYKWPNRYLVQPKKWQKKEGSYLSYSNRLIVLSLTFKKHLCEQYSFLKPSNIFVVPNYPNFDKLFGHRIDRSIIDRYQFSAPILLYFGGVSHRRGIYDAIEAVSMVNEAKIKCQLMVIGPVDRAERAHFKSLISAPRYRDIVIYIDWIDISLLPTYLTLSTICISPIHKNAQHDSGIANKVFQYAAFGKAQIVSNSKSQALFVQESNCGLVFKSHDTRDFAHKISSLLLDDEQIIELGKNGRKALSKLHRSNDYDNRIKSVFQSLA